MNNSLREITKDDYCVECGAPLGCAIWDHKKKKLVKECGECHHKHYFAVSIPEDKNKERKGEKR